MCFSSELTSAKSHAKIDLFSLHETKEFFANETKKAKDYLRKESQKAKDFIGKESEKFLNSIKTDSNEFNQTKILSASYGNSDVTEKVRDLIE